MRIFYITFLVFFFFTPKLLAQYCGKVVYGLEDGVINPMAGAVIDSKGNFWGSSVGGINLFDGKKWKNLTTDDGLIINKAYHRIEDKEGGIWFAHGSSSGMSRYINGQFEQYVYSAFGVDSLKEGQKWFPYASYTQQIACDKRTGKLVVFHQSQSRQYWFHEYDYISQSFKKERTPFLNEALFKKYEPYLKYQEMSGNWMHIDWKNDFYLAVVVGKETHLIYQDGHIIKLPINGFLSITDFWTPDGKGGQHVYKPEKNQLLKFQDSKWVPVPPPNLERYGKDFQNVKLFFFKSFTRLMPLGKYDLYTMWKIEDEDFEDSFVLAIHEPFTDKVIQTMLLEEEESVWATAHFIKDKAGTYWYHSGQNLVRLFPNQMIIPKGFQDLPKDVWSITGTANDRVWFSAFSTDSTEVGLRSFDGLKLKEPKGELATYFKMPAGSVSDKKGNKYFSIDSTWPSRKKSGVLKIDNTGTSEELIEEVRGAILGWDKKGGLMYGTKHYGMWILPKEKKGIEQSDWKRIDGKKGLGVQPINDAIQTTQGNYWMGNIATGLAIYYPEQDTVFNWTKEKDKTNYGVQCLAEDAKGNIWLGTDKGLGFFKNENPHSSLNLKDNIQMVAADYTGKVSIEVCKLYDEKTLLIGNRKGFFLLDLEAWYRTPRQLIIQSFNASSGHQGKAVFANSSWVDSKKRIWLSCIDGVIRYTPDVLNRDTLSPSIRIDNLEVGEQVFTYFSKKIKLSATERTIKINISHPTNPMLLDNIRFRHRINDEDWSELSDEPSIEYYNLAAANYVFEVIAEKNGLRSLPSQIKFRIAPVLWQNPWFWAAIMCVLLVIGLYFRRKEVQILQQEIELGKTKTDMDNINKEKEKLEIQVIINQLNPHFINNALQWLQVRLDDNEDEEGVKVVGKLSENIRTVFKNSRDQKAYHSIVDEMKLVENYLFIQKRRFKDKLFYDIPNGANLQGLEAVDVPLLMIQIHVENAVEHGIRNKKRGGCVKVTYTENDKYVIVQIEDDGIGRKQAQVIGSKGTQNGTKMLEELINYYNNLNTFSVSQRFEDDIFTNEQGEGYGTRSIIQIPKQYNYNL